MVRAGRQGFGPLRGHVSWVVLLSVALAGCGDMGREASRGGALMDLALPTTSRTVERDVPAPQVFQVTESGLWDGRPSLGGVWVAHPTARDPERVLIRNTVTGAEAVGALFRRERENPGPRFQISSEAAAALGILAGQPATLQVTALRLERIEAAPAPAPAAAPADAPATAEAPAPEAEAEAPRRTLADLFRRSAAPEPVAESAAPAAPPAAPPALLPALPPAGAVAITAVDPEPAAPRRGLLDLFRRPDQPEGPAGIAQTTLAPVAPVAEPAAAAAPLAATAMLAAEAPRPARHSDPALLAPSAAEPAPRPGFLDLFRRRPAEPAPEAADTTQIPLPTLAAAPVPQATVAPAPARTAPTRGRSFVQVGIFAVEANARRTQAQMRSAGLPAEIRAGRSGEREFWRVVVGPAADAPAQADLLARTRAMGFADAYAVAR